MRTGKDREVFLLLFCIENIYRLLFAHLIVALQRVHIKPPMDYEFTTDDYDRPVAKFSIGHEAIGLWISEELRSDQQKITALLDNIRRLEQRDINQYHIEGRDFYLRLNDFQIEVIALALNIDVDEELPEDTHFYDQESYAECGLQDFKQAVLNWQSFVHS